MMEREIAIGVNAAIGMEVYRKLSEENKVFSCDDIDVELLCEDISKIAIKCTDSIKEYGWAENVTDFIERELLELYGVKWEV